MFKNSPQNRILWSSGSRNVIILCSSTFIGFILRKLEQDKLDKVVIIKSLEIFTLKMESRSVFKLKYYIIII